MKDKLHIIYKPFFLIALGFLVTYTFLHWLLFIKAGIPLKENIIKFWLPFGLPYIPVLIWLRPRIKLLKFKNENASFFYQLLACIAIAVPTIIAQEYLVTSTGELTKLDHISQLSKIKDTKFYALKNYDIDKQHIAIQNTVSVSGRYNEKFDMFIYVVMPILDNKSGTNNHIHQYWLGKKYFKQVSNRLSDEEKEREYKLFAEESEKNFDTANFNRFSYLEKIGNTEDHDEYNKALEKIEKYSSTDNIIFEPKTEPFEVRNGKKLSWILGSLGIGLLSYFILLLFPKFQEKELETFKKSGKAGNNDDLKELLDVFIPKEGFFITPILINLNILIYIIMVVSGLGLISFKSDDLLKWGANFRPLIIEGQWWRLLTNIFLHGGIIHIANNMMALFFVGIFIEPLLGRARYFLLYLVTGVLASITSTLWYNGVISVGASGAIFGLYGFVLACLLMKIFSPEFGRIFLIITLVFVGISLIMGLMGGIDNAAHIGGLVSGFLIGIITLGKLKKELAAKGIDETEDETK
ncbi:rhomboid family intramembrane serine protease [Chryseobacterium arthrosphaerae]|uniref:Peptidase S54 rhomboid domain-containing protein n=1 Tax=Chryseobacterium arthrosphaerae TaxID=651561 RepID=A0A1B8ZP43_9FLAO|nr:rhomboid family intramembrane serine protease [Chryseobacterium arthrosphaerae]OCA73355.1 hypothetical protein BBI00_02905 [Chryseobacterium arthrosphaerae]